MLFCIPIFREQRLLVKTNILVIYRSVGVRATPFCNYIPVLTRFDDFNIDWTGHEPVATDKMSRLWPLPYKTTSFGLWTLSEQNKYLLSKYFNWSKSSAHKVPANSLTNLPLEKLLFRPTLNRSSKESLGFTTCEQGHHALSEMWVFTFVQKSCP